jgi:NAD(P)-dependent dehydrogenase (short-subunit alcohol dehydrogenase family)
MDLGIAGRWALVCAASKGLGKGCAQALVREGVNVVITARGAETLNATADELRALGGGAVHAVVGDITTEAGRAAALGACPQVDILVNNAGGPPPGDFRDWDRAAWVQASRLRPRRQHHFGRGESADRFIGLVERRTLRPDGVRCGPGAQRHRRPRRHDQRLAARRVRYRPPARGHARCSRQVGATLRCDLGPACAGRPRPTYRQRCRVR